MWNVPHYRIRAYVKGLRKTKGQTTEVAKPHFHLKRAAADLAVSGGFGTEVQIIPARLILNDFTPTGVTVFSSKPFQPGQRIALTLQDPQTFYVRGSVKACHLYSLQNGLISGQNFPYRVRIQFNFQSRTEEEMIKRFCEETLVEILYGEF
jgi:hypothetical protein